jgi:hypothetical protein
MASGVASVAVDVASGVVDGVDSAAVPSDEDADDGIESLENAEVSEESTLWVESLVEAHPAAINTATHIFGSRALLLMKDPNVHGDLNFFYLCVV